MSCIGENVLERVAPVHRYGVQVYAAQSSDLQVVETHGRESHDLK